MRGRTFQRKTGANGKPIKGSPWSYMVDLGPDPATGKRRQRMRGGFRTRKEAEDALTEVLRQVREGQVIDRTKRTVATFLESEWLPAIRSTVRPSTFESYSTKLTRHIVPRIGQLPLDAVTPAVLNALYADLGDAGRRDSKGGLSAGSVRQVHVVLHRALRDAGRWGLLNRNPASLADPPRTNQRRRMTVWSADELRAFLASIADDRLYPIVLLAGTTGLRRGELLGLHWADVDLENARLAVRQSLVPVDKGAVFLEPKTERSRRLVGLDPTTVSALRAHRARQLEERLALGPAFRDHDLVFARVDGHPLNPEAISLAFKRRVAASGLPMIRFHDLRHGWATMALRAGIHAKVVGDQLGHSSVSVTLDVYSHTTPGMQAEAVRTVAATIFGDGRP